MSLASQNAQKLTKQAGRPSPTQILGNGVVGYLNLNHAIPEK